MLGGATESYLDCCLHVVTIVLPALHQKLLV